jgi:hypothetical protein
VLRPARAALSLLLLALCVACDSLEFERTYATHADAVADDAIVRGWIPPFVPASAREIREIHDLVPTHFAWMERADRRALY